MYVVAMSRHNDGLIDEGRRGYQKKGQIGIKRLEQA